MRGLVKNIATGSPDNWRKGHCEKLLWPGVGQNMLWVGQTLYEIYVAYLYSGRCDVVVHVTS